MTKQDLGTGIVGRCHLLDLPTVLTFKDAPTRGLQEITIHRSNQGIPGRNIILLLVIFQAAPTGSWSPDQVISMALIRFHLTVSPNIPYC